MNDEPKEKPTSSNGVDPNEDESRVHPESLSFSFDVGPTAIHQAESGEGGSTPSNANEQTDGLSIIESSDGSEKLLVELSGGEKLDGSIGSYARLSENHGGGTYEYGEIYAEQRNQESVPFLPDSIANLDLARLTVWGWGLLLGSFIGAVAASAGIANLLGIERFPKQVIVIPALGMWIVAFLFGRVLLESNNFIVLRRHVDDVGDLPIEK